MGSVYLRGKTYWIRYRKNGKNVYESAKSSKKMVANELLTSREAAINEGREIVISHGNFEYLKQLILDDYQVNGKRSIDRVKLSISHLEGYFRGYKADRILTSDLRSYTAERLEQGASNGTINRELACLRRMLRLAYQDGRINKIPFFPMLKEGNPRQGFFEHNEYLTLLRVLPAYLRPVIIFAYRTGWRKQEILKLKWDQVDLKERYIYLKPDQTKNEDARSIYISDELYKMLKILKFKSEGNPYVFQNKGKPIRFFQKAWKTACKDADLSGKLFHDFRRTAARNLTRSGTQETVAMRITGHKTRSIFDRYNISSQDDIRAAIERQEKFLSEKSVTKSVTIDEKKQKSNLGSKAQVINLKR